jgi:N-acetylmuramoyl-L-alanine amidase
MVVQQTLARTHPGSNRGVKQAGFAVLARAYMPAVLIEVGFGSNQSDARWMASPTGQRDASVAIADAIFEYLLHYERRTGSQPR